MFDRSYHRDGDSYHTTKITQQPHDAADAARLYGSLEDKATSKVVAVVAQQLPSIDTTYARIQQERSVLQMTEHHTVVFKINGRTVTTRVDRHDFDTRETTMQKELQVISEEVAKEVMKLIAADVYRHSFGRMWK